MGDGPEPWTRRFLVISASRRAGEGARAFLVLLEQGALAGATGAQAAGRRSCEQGPGRWSSRAVLPHGGAGVAHRPTGPTRSIRLAVIIRTVSLGVQQPNRSVLSSEPWRQGPRHRSYKEVSTGTNWTSPECGWAAGDACAQQTLVERRSDGWLMAPPHPASCPTGEGGANGESHESPSEHETRPRSARAGAHG